jgi:hypothetical protein
MNTIRQLQTGESAIEGRSLGANNRQTTEAKDTEASVEDAGVVGGSGSGKDDVVNAGDLWAGDVRATEWSTGVRVAIVAGKSGNADGAKGDRKANASSQRLKSGQASGDALAEVDGWVRGRMRSILRKRCKKRGRGRGSDNQRWGNSYFAEHGLILPRAGTSLGNRRSP